jgi:hypothetical protein
MAIRCIVNPEIGTNIFCTLDGRVPSENDHDFGADFYWSGNEIEVANAVADMVAAVNSVKDLPDLLVDYSYKLPLTKG